MRFLKRLVKYIFQFVRVKFFQAMFQEKKLQVINQIKEFWPVSQLQEKVLEDFVALLIKSNEQYNLIGKSTIDDIWNRHILDSAQLLQYIKNTDLVTGDFGSGAGFPGVVLSILGIKEVHLIEKSFRKCQFLELAKKLSPNKIIIHQQEAGKIKGIKFDLIVSRAFAPMNRLLETIQPFAKKDSICLFLKGKSFDEELNLAKKIYNFNFTAHLSLTSKESRLIILDTLSLT
jgi:16S rRNA (guanine527-N7)-methyltransferase